MTIFLTAALLALSFSGPPATATIRVDRTKVIRAFDPRTAFGAAVDGHSAGECERMLTPENTRLMKSMGLRSLTYRLRTELGDDVWHWNPEGAWSDEKHQQGYWVSSPTSSKPILLTYGYRLPRRGNSLDQANRDSYSRLDDGDPHTFWKSSPYLDPAFTGVSYEKSPQWIVLDLKVPKRLNELRIQWMEPYATRFRVEYVESDRVDGVWRSARQITHAKQHPGTNIIRFAPFSAQKIRIDLIASSEKAPADSHDRRDGMGFAVAEVSAGLTTPDGRFHDEVKHGTNNMAQTIAFVSSTDPWHRAIDQDDRVEQPGFDLVLQRGLDQGQPVLMSTGCLYDTPDNVANEIRWLRSRHIPLRGIELGEEPDGNWGDPTQFAELYMQVASKVRSVYPDARLGGPSFQTVFEDYHEWPRRGGAWLTQFRASLARHHRMKDFSFCSFEWYPFDNVLADPEIGLRKATRLLRKSVDRLNRLGMSGMPWFITEYGWSAYAAPAEVDLPGGIFDFEVALTALALGCETSYLYGYEPDDVIQEIPGAWGNLLAILSREDGVYRLPCYWGSWLLTHRLCSQAGRHFLLAVSGGDESLGAYAVKNPDGSVRLALLNRSRKPRAVRIPGGSARKEIWTYGSSQFRWTHVSEDENPEIAGTPDYTTSTSSSRLLPPFSITIVKLEP